ASVAQGDLEDTRPDEVRIAANQFRSRIMVLIEMSLDQVIDHFFLARVDPGHVDGDRASFHPEFVVARAERRHLRALNDVLSRQALFGHDPPTFFRSTTAVRLPSRAIVQPISLPPVPPPNTSTS